MRKILKVFTLLFLTTFILSCSNLSNQEEKKETTIEFDFGSVISQILKNSKNRYNKNNLSRNISPDMKSRTAEGNDLTQEQVEAIINAMDFTLNVRVSLSGGYENTLTENYKVNPFDGTSVSNPVLQFPEVPVGVRIKANADLTTNVQVKNADAVGALAEAFGLSAEVLENINICSLIAEESGFAYALTGESEETTIQAGTNQISIPMTLVESDEPGGTGDPTEPGGTGDPTGPGGQSEEEEEEEEEEEDPDISVEGSILAQYADKLIILINQEESDSRFYLNKGKLVFKLIDEDGNNLLANQENSRVDWTYKLTLRDTEIPKSGASGLRYEANTSAGSFEIKDMPAAGNYQLYVQAQKFDNGNYSPSAPTSAVFDLPVDGTNFYSFNAENLMDGTDVSSEFTSFVGSITSDATIKFTGTTASDYAGVFSSIKNYFTGFNNGPIFQYFVDLDFSEMTTTSTDKYTGSGNTVSTFVQLRSIIFPDDLPELANGDFANCTNLKSVSFGSGIQQIGDGSVPVFIDCSNLKKVEFAKTDGWYNLTPNIDVSSVDWSTLDALDVSDPEENATHLKNGDWKYLYRKTE